MKLSILITCVDDPHELLKTLESIRQTAGDKPEVIVCCDFSSTKTTVPDEYGVKLIHNTMRCGVGPSRTIAAMHATGENLLILDSHMRLMGNWYETALWHLDGRNKTLFCCSCPAIDSKHLDPLNPVHVYTGATLNVWGPDRGAAGKMQCMECVWLPPLGPKNDAELPAVMGAAYFLNREFFLKIGALKHLLFWGSDELFLSLKAWLSGGEVRFARDISIAHKFLLKGEKQMFSVPPGAVTYNKLFAIATLLPPHLQPTLVDKLRSVTDKWEFDLATKMMQQNAGLVGVEAAYNYTQLFRRDFIAYCSHFGITLS